MIGEILLRAAKQLGIDKRTGSIEQGKDADIVVWDPEKKLTISAKTHHTNVNYNLFEGEEVKGAPEVVLVAGPAPTIPLEVSGPSRNQRTVSAW